MSFLGFFRDKKYEARVAFYEQRKRDYIAALPSSYPYVAGWDGVDDRDMAIVKTGPVNWNVIPMSEAERRGYPKHPLTFDPRFKTKYIGDFYMSTGQMKRQVYKNGNLVEEIC